MKDILTFILLSIIVTLISISLELSAITIGGLILWMGGYFTYIGNIFFGVISYAGADVCWLINAYQHGDIFGAITVTVGIIIGILVTIKMQRGKFHKTVRKEI